MPRDDLPRVPDPELLDLTAPGAREALARFADAITTEALDWLFDRAMDRPIHPDSYPDSRRRFFGTDGSPAAMRRRTACPPTTCFARSGNASRR